MNKTIGDIRLELEKLVTQKEKIKDQLVLVSDDINRKDQELKNMLASELVGKFIKRSVKQGLKYGISYGVIHSIVDINTVKVMRVGFTVNNKIDRSCELVDISDFDFVSESEVSSYIFDFIIHRYAEWRGINE